MKIVAIILVLILIVIAAVLILSPKAPENVESLQVNNATSTEESHNEDKDAEGIHANIELTDFSFVGYGPGKSHVGKFEKYEVKEVHVNNGGIPVGGELVIQTNSVKTDTSMLDTHLCEKENFFNCAKYPEIKFSLSNVTEMSEGTYQVSGNLTVKDVTKNVAFSVKANMDKTFSSEFKLKMSDFGFTAPGIVDDEVLVKFSGKLI